MLPCFFPHLSPACHTSALFSLALIIFFSFFFLFYAEDTLLSHLFFSHSFFILSFALFPLHVCFLLTFFAANAFFFSGSSTVCFAAPLLIYQNSHHVSFLDLSAQHADWSSANHWSDPMLSCRGVGWVAVVRQVQIRASRQHEAPFACKET